MLLVPFEILVGAEMIFLINFFLIGLFDNGLYFMIPWIFGAFLPFVVLYQLIVYLILH